MIDYFHRYRPFAIACLLLMGLISPLSAQDTRTPEADFATTLSMAREGNPEAMYVVAMRLLEEETPDYNKDAFGWALNAARSGHSDAAELTGKLYRLGIGVEKNYVKARKWLFRARSRGATGAHFELALLFRDEENPAYNEETAAQHMIDALSRNEPRACLLPPWQKSIAAGPFEMR